MSVVDKLLQNISAVWYNAFGNSDLKRHEEVCLTTWNVLLPVEEQKKLKAQLEKFNLIQRPASGLKSVFYDIKDSEYLSWSEQELFSVREQNLKVFSGTLVGKQGDVELKIAFKIFLHRGRLSSLEFDSPPSSLNKCDDLSVVKSKLLFNFEN